MPARPGCWRCSVRGARHDELGLCVHGFGRLDGTVTLDEVGEHATALDRVTELALSVDLENGYGAVR